MTWRPYIFIVGAWSQWNREVVVVEAEKVKEENQEMTAYVKWMDVAIPFSFMFVAPTLVAVLILLVVPSLQSSLRKLWNAEVWHVVVKVFEDCSDGHICQTSWIELQVQVTVAFIWSSTY